MTPNELTSKFAYSSTRHAGERQTLTILGEEYGFCWIPPGEFDMGSPEHEVSRWDDETFHHVKITRGFWLLETPVTQRLYESVMGTNPSWFKSWDSSNSSDGNVGERYGLPVENVSYNDVVAFCEKITELTPQGTTATLPTEAEWEYACRAGTQTLFWFGDALNGSQANCNGTRPFPKIVEKGPYLCQTSPVKSYPPNPWGLYDMHGNVYEWVQDFYANYPKDEVVDYVKLDGGVSRVYRGGSWRNDAVNCRAALRRGDNPNYRLYTIGARFALRPQAE